MYHQWEPVIAAWQQYFKLALRWRGMSTQSRGFPQGSAGNWDLTAQLLSPHFPTRVSVSGETTEESWFLRAAQKNTCLWRRGTRLNRAFFPRVCRGREGKFLREMFAAPPFPPLRDVQELRLFGRHRKTIIRPNLICCLCVNQCCSGKLYLKVALFLSYFIYQEEAHLHRSLSPHQVCKSSNLTGL